VIKILKKISGIFHSEKELQDAIESALAKNMIAFRREPILTKRDRPDFFLTVTGTVIEVKIKGSASDVALQVLRYASHPDVKEIVIVTTKFQHLAKLPRIVNEKPIYVVVIHGGL
jgi:hypothetical protein